MKPNMCILTCSKQLMSFIFAKNVMHDYVGVVRTACFMSKVRHNGDLLHRRLSFHHHQKPRLFACHSGIARYYSDMYNESTDSKKINVEVGSQEQADEAESDVEVTSYKQATEEFNIDVMVSLLRQENAVDICVIKVPDNLKYTDYFIVVSGISPRHLRAMALYAIKVYKFMRKHGDPHVKVEGKDAEDWMCIDFGNMVVHFMLPETREVYELEKLWTLRAHDEQLMSIPPETLPEDFMYGIDVTK